MRGAGSELPSFTSQSVGDDFFPPTDSVGPPIPKPAMGRDVFLPSSGERVGDEWSAAGGREFGLESRLPSRFIVILATLNPEEPTCGEDTIRSYLRESISLLAGPVGLSRRSQT